MKAHLYIVMILAICVHACTGDASKKEVAKNSKKDTTVSETTSKVPISINDHLITDTSFGIITSATNYTQLQELFGKNNLKDEVEYGAEGMDSFMVTKVYPGTAKEIVIQWKENNHHQIISSAETYKENAPYHTADNLKIGSTLQQLLRVNGQPIRFLGPGWDYGGFIVSYNKGKFDDSKIRYRLNGAEDLDQNLLGDQEFNTNMPLVKNNVTKLYIGEIAVSFER